MNTLTSFLLLGFLAGCAATSDSEGVETSDVALRGDLATLPGPVRLRGSCTIGGAALHGAHGGSFEVDPDDVDGGSLFLGEINVMDSASFGVSVGRAPDYAVTLETRRWHHWSKGFTPSVTVTRPSVHEGESVTLEDSTIFPGHTVACTGTLASLPRAR